MFSETWINNTFPKLQIFLKEYSRFFWSHALSSNGGGIKEAFKTS